MMNVFVYLFLCLGICLAGVLLSLVVVRIQHRRWIQRNTSTLTLSSTSWIRPGQIIDVMGEEFVVIDPPKGNAIRVIPRCLVDG